LGNGVIGITLEEPRTNGAWSLEQGLVNLSIHDNFQRLTNPNSYTSSLQRDSRNVWSPTSDTLHFPLTNGTTGTVYAALSEEPRVNGEVSGGRVGREDTSSPSLGNQPAAHRRSTASQHTATTTTMTRDIIILFDPEHRCRLYSCSTETTSSCVAPDLRDCFGLDDRYGVTLLLRRLGLATPYTAEDNNIGHYADPNTKIGLPYMTLPVELHKNVEIDDHDLGMNQDQQALELFEVLRERIGNHWSNIQHLSGASMAQVAHYPTMVLLQNSVLSIETRDIGNMVDVLISTLSNQSVPLSADASAWIVNRIGTSKNDMNNRSGHKVSVEHKRSIAGEHYQFTFDVMRQSDVAVAKTLTKFIANLLFGFIVDDSSEPGLSQHFPRANAVKLVVGLLNRDRAEGEFDGYVLTKFVHPLILTHLTNVSFSTTSFTWH